MGVHPDFRKKGIGKILYARFFDICRTHGRTVVRACTLLFSLWPIIRVLCYRKIHIFALFTSARNIDIAVLAANRTLGSFKKISRLERTINGTSFAEAGACRL
jgi:GNAT superfamily N-acetyltransferase